MTKRWDEKYYLKHRELHANDMCWMEGCNDSAQDDHHILGRVPGFKGRCLIPLCRLHHGICEKQPLLTDYLLMLMVKHEPDKRDELYELDGRYRLIIK